MKVIKHGKQYNPRQVTCKKCECIFIYGDKDIKTGGVDKTDDVHKWVACPECRFLNYLKGI